MYNEYLGTNYGSIYDIVRKGEWTMDKLTEMTSGIWGDDDGDEKTTSGDTLALALPVWDNTNGMSVSAGIQYSYRHDDGTI